MYKVARATAGQRWSKFMAEWDAKPHIQNPDLERRTVARLVAAYKAHAEEYYRRPDGTPTKEHVGINYAVTPLAEALAAGRTAAKESPGVKPVPPRPTSTRCSTSACPPSGR